MDYTSETLGKIPAGDTKPNTAEYKPSDIDGFVNPVIDGQVDTTRYIPADAAGTPGAPEFSREEALEQASGPAETLYGKKAKK
jgi:hypothetical protein